MIVDDQVETRAFLASAMAETGEISLVETHISQLVLGPSIVWKLKRAVLLPYADFSTPDRRLEACRLEVGRNRATAPRHYLRARRITREPHGLAFDGPGPLVDAVVEMRRFDEDRLLDRLADRGALAPALIETLAAEIARFHARAPVAAGRSGADHIADVLAVNEASLAGSSVFPAAEVAVFNARFRDAAGRHRTLLDARAREGRVRLAHGDLHLRNIFLDEDGRPVLFDCIEFNDAIATVDVLYDLAFVLMDLVHRGRRTEANLLMNRYLDAPETAPGGGGGDDGGLPLLPFFMALRAAVRAHVAAAAIGAGDDTAERRAEARAYFERALALLEPVPITVVALGGLSGTGKSTVARALAPLVGAGAGARILASDRLRKALHGAAPDTRLPPAAYAPEASLHVYTRLVARTAAIASAGASVLADAVFAREPERRAIAEAARSARVPFRGYWLAAPPDILRARVAARTGDVSDADLAVLERQLGYDLGRLDWTRLDAEAPGDAIADAIARALPDAAEASRSLMAGRSYG